MSDLRVQRCPIVPPHRTMTSGAEGHRGIPDDRQPLESFATDNRVRSLVAALDLRSTSENRQLFQLIEGSLTDRAQWSDPERNFFNHAHTC